LVFFVSYGFWTNLPEVKLVRILKHSGRAIAVDDMGVCISQGADEMDVLRKLERKERRERMNNE